MDHYVDWTNVFKFLQLFSISFIVIFIVYSLLRGRFLGCTKTGPHAHTIKLWVLLMVFFVPTISLYLINSHYKNKNNEFITTKIINVKNSILAGKCSLQKTKNPSISYGKVSDCGDIKAKMPGDLWFLSSGQFTKNVKEAGIAKTVIIDKPNTITYNYYLPSFCKTLTDKNNLLYKEFSSIEVNGNNPLSKEFETSSCEDYKLKGQIQFMFK